MTAAATSAATASADPSHLSPSPSWTDRGSSARRGALERGAKLRRLGRRPATGATSSTKSERIAGSVCTMPGAASQVHVPPSSSAVTVTAPPCAAGTWVGDECHDANASASSPEATRRASTASTVRRSPIEPVTQGLSGRCREPVAVEACRRRSGVARVESAEHGAPEEEAAASATRPRAREEADEESTLASRERAARARARRPRARPLGDPLRRPRRRRGRLVARRRARGGHRGGRVPAAARAPRRRAGSCSRAATSSTCGRSASGVGVGLPRPHDPARQGQRRLDRARARRSARRPDRRHGRGDRRRHAPARRARCS